MFRGNDTCCRGGNDLLGPRVRSSLAPRPLHSALFLSSNTTRECMHAPSPHPSHLLFLLHHPFLPFIFSALHPSLFCHGRSAANPSRVGAGRGVRACVGVCVDVCVMTEYANLSHVCAVVAHSEDPTVLESIWCLHASFCTQTHTYTHASSLFHL